jgi:hypothetical protein
MSIVRSNFVGCRAGKPAHVAGALALSAVNALIRPRMAVSTNKSLNGDAVRPAKTVVNRLGFPNGPQLMMTISAPLKADQLRMRRGIGPTSRWRRYEASSKRTETDSLVGSSKVAWKYLALA